MAVVVLAGAGWATVELVSANTGDGDCVTPTVVRVAAAPDIAPVVTQLGRALAEDGCYRIEVRDRESATVAESLAVSDGSERPHVWLPDSTLNLRRARDAGATDVPESGTSVASSPVVLALAKDTATTLGWPDSSPGWAEVLGQSDVVFGIPDPARDPVGVSALLGVREATKTAGDPAAAYAAALRRFTPNATDGSAALFGRLPGSATQERPVTAFPASENSVLRHNAKQSEAGLIAAYSAAAIPALDYPFAVLDGIGGSEKAGAERLLRALAGQEGATALGDAGFRTPDGRMLRDRSVDQRISAQYKPAVPLPPGTAVDEVLNQWAGVNLSSRARVLVDVSGSMNAAVPGSGKTRMGITLEAAERGLRLFKATSKIGIWTFSTELDGDKDYREIVPMAPIGEHLDEVSAKLRAVKATAEGRTGLYDSVLAAYRQARQEWEPGRLNVVVVLTDGRNEDPGGISREGLLAELAGLHDPRRPVSIIGIGIGPDIDPAELDAITTPTGGKAFTTPDPTKIGDVFYAALGKLACQPPSC
ncbi:substrate-binding and VWA domain-containing protein [Amycolatopsis nigrescens]|uniref:substrate-binding and VWA domain-containing protein n=1 Tax=Amycolatopsis nigrescens TaxID=381445 RepID=UPI0003AB0D08|nr:substrate-binding and VWA domain-containing protein [Amycolatopsis nigrescens]